MIQFEKLRSTGQGENIISSMDSFIKYNDPELYDRMLEHRGYSVRLRDYEVETLGSKIKEYLDPPYTGALLNALCDEAGCEVPSQLHPDTF